MSVLSSKFFTLLFFIVLLIQNGSSFPTALRKRDLTQCSGSYHITNLNFLPNPIPLYLSSLTATISGTTDVQITGGSIVASVYGSNYTVQTCDYVTCPIAAGPFSFNITENIPTSITSACVAIELAGANVVLNAYDTSGNVLGCVQGNVP
ncbi:5272_t:CDS:2, partial [Dentiscutata erythropus]